MSHLRTCPVGRLVALRTTQQKAWSVGGTPKNSAMTVRTFLRTGGFL